jgi:hypothetical protein
VDELSQLSTQAFGDAVHDLNDRALKQLLSKGLKAATKDGDEQQEVCARARLCNRLRASASAWLGVLLFWGCRALAAKVPAAWSASAHVPALGA